MIDPDTIAAPVTPPGYGGVGIVRVSGPAAGTIAAAVAPPLPSPHQAALRRFRDGAGVAIDEGLVLWFPGPGSYTGEDTVEFHGHGGPAVVDALHARMLELGARPARPGEFTERAFLNGRLDLAQAEAVADLIESGDAAGARAAMRSLEGAFSRRVHALRDELTALRAWIEAALDFPEDEIDFLADTALRDRLDALITDLADTRNSAAEGRRLVEGLTIVIAGAPNAGKSSLLNALAGADSAIVTAIAGTTRDVLRESIRLDGVPLTLLDTAGLRATDDPVESEGVRRARAALDEADRVLLVVDSGADAAMETPELPPGAIVDTVRTKIDLTGEPAGVTETDQGRVFRLSAVTGEGLDALRAHLRSLLGTGPEGGAFSARRRHLDALDRADEEIRAARTELVDTGAGELAAERLRQAQTAIGAITGETTTEDLLGEIFSRFCIGK
ncbi:MAG: tRNA uridine-5-carboxymethylaminomethyl(34) synthesis GTPase MnmE [Halofilum sp. (in: g-proteobacteria)]|nr:tRNA uridine-5-carboxymethylaminomethyl(34) synthesis GTPase MnmE [Halofilum sp. (in: g-proteobacteria)]